MRVYSIIFKTTMLITCRAYGAFFKFFRKEVEDLGVSSALDTYVFRPEANVGGKVMLNRLVSGA